MAGKVFINHRRLLNEQDAEILFNRLVMGRHVAERDLFIDRRGLDGTADWKSTLKEQVHASDVMVVVIGDGEIDGKPVSWLDIPFPEGHPKAGKRRLDDPEDLVRYEIVEAIDRGIPLVPVLVNGARMPLPDARLPLDMWPLTKPQTLELRTKAGALPETYVPKIGDVIAARRSERRRSKASISQGVTLLMMTATAILGAAVAAFGVLQFPIGHRPADEVAVRLLQDQINDYRRLAEEANAKAAARSAQFREIDPSGPWGIEWKWVSPNCKGGYNLVVDQGGNISVFGKDVLMQGSGLALSNGRFFVKFTIDTGKYTLTADGSIGSLAGEAQLHAVAKPGGEPYCQGPITITRGRLPKTLVGGGNGN